MTHPEQPEGEDLDRLLNAQDPLARASFGNTHLLELGQIHENIAELLERHQIDPATPTYLVNAIDPTTLALVISNGLADLVAKDIVATGVELLAAQGQPIDPARIETLDLQEFIDVTPLDAGAVQLAQRITRDHIDPARDPSTIDYQITKLPARVQADVMHASIATFIVLNHLLGDQR